MPLNIRPITDVIEYNDPSENLVRTAISRQKLFRLQDQIEKLQADANALIDEMCKECIHPIDQVVEAEPEENDYHRLYDTDFRLCKLCGYAENGAYGYHKLGRGVLADYGDGEGIPVVNRNDAEKMITKMRSSEEMLDMIRSSK
jgi:hypothetical protein